MEGDCCASKPLITTFRFQKSTWSENDTVNDTVTAWAVPLGHEKLKSKVKVRIERCAMWPISQSTLLTEIEDA